MRKKILLLCVCVVLFLCAPIGAIAADEDEATTFNLRVTTDFHLNQDGRPVPDYDFLVPVYADEESVLFFNPRYHIDDRSNLHRAEEWNLGLGYRHMIGDKAILGANVYYDWRRSMTGNQFEQVGAGLELMTDDVTARINGYLALSGPEEVGRYRWREYYFASRSLNYNEYESVSYEVPTSGFDGEIGFKVPYISDYAETWVYGGGYYFEPVSSIGGAETMEGVKGRIEVKPTDYLKASCEVRDDNVRGTAYYGEIAVEVPFSIENLIAGKNPFAGLKEKVVEPSYEVALADRLYDKVERDPDIITGYNSTTKEVLNDGVYVDLVYVKNTAAAGGDGSYATPYNTITDGLADGDIPTSVLMILAGNTLATYANPYGDFTVSTAGTTVWGQGYKPSGVTMPYSLAVSYPKIYGTATINAADVEIMGFSFADTGLYGITVNSTATNAYVHHNEFRSGNNTGMLLFDGIGAVVENNKFYSAYRGIELVGDDTANTSDTQILKNTFTVAYTGSIAWDTVHTPGTGTSGIYSSFAGDIGALGAPLLISGNTFTITNTNTNTTSGPTVHGIDLNVSGTGNAVNTIIYNNTLKVSSTNAATNSGSYYRTAGIHLYAPGTITANISKNNLSGGITGKWDTWGISLGNNYGGGDASVSIDADIYQNKLKVSTTATATGGYDAEVYGIYALTSSGSLTADIMANNLSAGVIGRGYTGAIYLESGGDGTYNIYNNLLKATAVTNTASGISATAAGYLTAYVLGNKLSLITSSASPYAFGILLDSGTGMDIDVLSNTMVVTASGLWESSADEAAAGIYARTGTGDLLADILNNTISGGITGKENAYGICLINEDTTTGLIDADILNNTLKVTSTYAGTTDDYGHAYGIKLDAGTGNIGNIFGMIANNIMSAGVTGKYSATGIDVESGHYIGYDGSDVYPVSIVNNSMKATSSAGEAHGIWLDAVDAIAADIIGNDLSAGITGKTLAGGIVLETLATYDWAWTTAEISDNKMKVTVTDTTADSGDAYGISIYSTSIFDTDIINNDLSAGITGYDDADPIGLYSYEPTHGIGSAGDPVTIAGNKIKSTSTGVDSEAMGIFMESYGYMYADINYNDLSYGISGKYFTAGISLVSSGGTLGSSTAGLNIIGNKIKANTSYIGTVEDDNKTYGIFIGPEESEITGWGNILGTIDGNDLSAGITGKYTTAGIFIESAGDIGTTSDYTSIIGNKLKVTSSAGEASGIYLTTTTATGMGNTFSTIAANDLSAGITGKYNTVGIYLNVDGDIGSATDYSYITANKLKVTSSAGLAAGIFGLGTDTTGLLYVDVTGNDLSAGVTGGVTAVGIGLGFDPFGATLEYSGAVYADVSKNLLSVKSTYTGTASGFNGYALGIIMMAGVVDAYANYNDLHWGISGKYDTFGIFADGEVGDVDLTATNNIIKGTSTAGIANGIRGTSSGDLNAIINGNDLSAGITGNDFTAGIYMESGSDTNACHVSVEVTDNTIKALTNYTGVLNGDYGTVYGIYCEPASDITGTISNNDMSAGISGKYETAGIKIIEEGSIGTYTGGSENYSPLNITFNDMKVTSSAGMAYGIYAASNLFDEADVGGILAYIAGNSMTVTGTTTTAGGVAGIYLSAPDYTGNTIGMVYSGTYFCPTVIAYNSMTVTNKNTTVSTGSAYGIYGSSYDDLFMVILGNEMTIKAYTNTAGAYLTSGIGNIGAYGYSLPTAYTATGGYTTFTRNSGTITRTLSTGNQYLLNLISSGGNNQVYWGTNTIVPTSGGWTGNYSNSINTNTGYGPIQTNFTTGIVP